MKGKYFKNIWKLSNGGNKKKKKKSNRNDTCLNQKN